MHGVHTHNAAGELRRHAVAAKRIGVSTKEYAQHEAAGDKWCSYLGHWSKCGDFGVTSLGRKDNYCLACRQRYNEVRRGQGASPRHTQTVDTAGAG